MPTTVIGTETTGTEARLEEIPDYLTTHEPGAWRCRFADFVVSVNIGKSWTFVQFNKGKIDKQYLDVGYQKAYFTKIFKTKMGMLNVIDYVE